jgi:hypothetical protein
VEGVVLEEAFVLDLDAGCVLAIARLVLDDGSTQRYTFALSGKPLAPAGEGGGVWRARLRPCAI